MADLSPRKEQILRAVIVEYVLAAEPVPSETIVQGYDLGVRSATVRNELAEITDLGLLEQPHTSAGRVPSDQGYRYFVDKLVVLRPPAPVEKRAVEDSASEEDTLSQLLQETTKTLSRLTHLLSAATLLRNIEVKVRSALVTAVGPGKALLVLILENGHVENRFLDCPVGLTMAQLAEANGALGKLTDGQTIGKLAKLKVPATNESLVGKVLRSAVQAVRAAAKDMTRGRLITEGEEYILAQPEFQRSREDMRALLASIEDEETLQAALIGEGVTIGKENRLESLQGLTIIRKAIFAGESEAGTLAIVGPKRLQYEKALSLLDFTAEAVSDALTKLAR
ncbi:MAG: heat-inducible transcription repressor HrcA [Armatimonadetes bacterium]|nr:heat-inducible transcription repressor HrcA [Armatimonadota bacterium]